MAEVNEASSDDNSEPGMSPALPTADDIRRNVAEWRAEVEARVAIAVTYALRHGRHPGEADMRRLSAEGRRLYYEGLRKAVSVPAAATKSAAGEPTSHKRPVRVAPARSGLRPLLLNEVDWRGQQHRRPPYTWRAKEEGIVLTLILAAFGTLVLHALPDHTALSRLSRLLEVFQ